MANESVVERKPRARKPKPKASTEEEQLLDDGGKDQTRAKFNELLQDAYLQSTRIEGKKKKKIASDKSMKADGKTSVDPKLESLKKGVGITKDSNESLLLANTFDPDDDPKSNKKGNKQRQREMKKTENGVDNVAYTEENEVHERRKPKKKKPVVNTDKPMTIEDLAESPVNTTESTEVPPPERRKKKKKQQEPTENNNREENEEEITRETAEPAEEPPQEEVDTEQTQAKVKKKKTKKKKVPTSDEQDEQPIEIEDHGRIVSLMIHRTDKLKTDFLLAHPVVRVTVIDEKTGNYLKKQHQTRRVTSYYERENVDFVLPMLTQPFDFKEKKSTLPVWEEMLVFNENYDYFVQPDPKIILFFEVLDFMSMNATSQRRRGPGYEGGWKRIGWGFLKLVGVNGQINTDRKVRLQLYQPPVRFNSSPMKQEIFQWWESAERIAYPSTLYVTVKGIIPPDIVEPAARSMFATQEERGQTSYDELQKTIDGATTDRDARLRGPSLWTRLTGQLCKVPNDLYLSLPAGRKGCYVVRFSLDGKLLACGCHDKDGYPILIYEIPSGKLKGQLNGHYSIIYDLCWSKNNTDLLTASADGTARVWDTKKMSNTPIKTLPHPAFVYTAKYHVRVSQVVVTGGYDRMIRVWSLKGEETHGQLVFELDNHKSYVNTLCFDAEGNTMYSGDSIGQIMVWTVLVTDKPSSNGVLRQWPLQKEISDTEIKGAAINSLTLHASGRRLLVHTRDNFLRLYDLRIGAFMQRYQGALNFRDHLRSTLTPCGSFVITGSEDSCAYVWNSDTGDQVARYQELGYRHAVSDVDFHPHDHMVAFCSFGENHQVLVYKYNHRVAQRDVGLETTDTAEVTQRRGRPMSPDIKAGTEMREDDEAMETIRSKTGTLETSKLQNVSRMQHARKMLTSVTAFQTGAFRTASSEHPLGVPRDTVPMTADYGVTWGSTFDSTGMYTDRPMSPDPSRFSPHASRLGTTSAAINQQQLAVHTDLMKQTQGGGWRPGFTEVGRHGTAGKPAISLTTGADKKPQLQILGAKMTKEWVVALHDYQKMRSDELNFCRGDVVRITCKDTDSWWLAQNSSGEEGYVPANYFTSEGEDREALDYQIESEHEESGGKHVQVAAVVSKSGELKFISGTEDSDAESTVQRRKKTRKSRDSQFAVLNIESESDTPTKVHRKRQTRKFESTA